MDKITPDHCARTAAVYVRQSTLGQLTHNPESRQRQYGLESLARSLGWSQVVVIDEDLGKSGGGSSRPGFEQLLSLICGGSIGAVFAIEASRLARNGRDWHTLLEFCGVVGTLIIDEDGTYDPRMINDRILLGMKGTFSELEYSTFRQRSVEALKLKASRGELYATIPVGYCRGADDRLEKTADRRIQETIELVFRKFRELGSVRQVALWMRGSAIDLPVLRNGNMVWRQATYTAAYAFLTNPIYAGAYAYGRRKSQTILEDGRKRTRQLIRREPSDWSVLIREHHEGYISWSDYERNRELISGNAMMKGAMVIGPARRGYALLPGLLRCGHCGRKLGVHYHVRKNAARYLCNPAMLHHGGRDRCLSCASNGLDAAVSAEVLRIVSPLGISAALAAIEERELRRCDKSRQMELALQQARYEADRARRQYDAADPENRLVTGELERRWNDRLQAITEIEDKIREFNSQTAPALSDDDRKRIMALGHDLKQVWDHPDTAVEIKKRIIRTLVKEIVVKAEPGFLDVVLHWHGGHHTKLSVKRKKSGEHGIKTDANTTELIGKLARMMNDQSIALVLNRLGCRTPRGLTWTELRIRHFRCVFEIPIYRPGEREERGEISLEQAAAQLNKHKMTVMRLIRDGILPATQVCSMGPYIIRDADVKALAANASNRQNSHVTSDERQQSLCFQ